MSRFFAVGPNDQLVFMHFAVDTNRKYIALVMLIVLHSGLTDVLADSINPHIINVLQGMHCMWWGWLLC